MSPTDEELIERAKAGDRPAVEELLARHDESVRARLEIGPGWGGDLDPDDVMQVSRIEVLLAFRRGTYRGDGLAFESFYRRIAENNVRDAIRRIKCRRGLLRDLEAGDSEADSDGERVTRFLTRLTRVGTTPSRGMHESERRALLDREIAKLPADYARVLRLFFFEDRSPGEIASEMGRSYGAVAMLKSRALEWLAGQLGSGTAVF